MKYQSKTGSTLSVMIAALSIFWLPSNANAQQGEEKDAPHEQLRPDLYADGCKKIMAPATIRQIVVQGNLILGIDSNNNLYRWVRREKVWVIHCERNRTSN